VRCCLYIWSVLFQFLFCFFLSNRGARRGARGCQRCLCRSLLLKYRDSSISLKIAAF
jgi:hypothetical protein